MSENPLNSTKSSSFCGIRRLFCLILLASCLSSVDAAAPVEIEGFVGARAMNCFNPDHAHEPDIEYFIHDKETKQKRVLIGAENKLRGKDLSKRYRIRGTKKEKPQAAQQGISRRAEVSPRFEIELEDVEVIEEPVSAQGGDAGGTESTSSSGGETAGGGATASGGSNSLTMLSTLLVFADSQDNVCMTNATAAQGLLFNNTNNANEGMQAITKGRYGLMLGNGVDPEDAISITLDGNSSSYADNDAMEAAILSKVFGTGPGELGLDRLAYNRILLFPPFGYSDAGFTAYAYYPYGSYTTNGMVSMYGNSYGDGRMNGYLHELGHNFGFAHSSLGGSEYGDRTCVMALSKDGTRTETYNAAKLMETDWLDTFNNATGTDASLTLTQDITVDLYPLSSDLTVVDETVAVRAESTYYIAYHRDDRPYGFLSQSGDRDKLFVYTRAPGSRQRSFQVANMSEGDVYIAGNLKVQFGEMGPSNTYATVSIDVDDGNAMPELPSDVYGTGQNQAVVLSMPATDADGDSISYVKLTDPANGVLSGSFPNLTYTPNNNFIGSDSFRITASDALISNYITVTVLTFVDSDTDGLDDDWELQYFGNLSQGPTGNPDNDQENNLTEFESGTDPTRAPTLFAKLTGTVIGTPGSYLGNPDWDKDEAWDDDFATYYDALNGTGDWTGLDLGSPKKFGLIQYAARSGQSGRMNGGMFQGSNTSDFSSGVVTFHTVNTNNTPSGTYTDQVVNDTETYRYIRYIGPVDGFCNIAEIEFWEDGAPDAPTGLSGASVNGAVNLNWNDSSDADLASYNVYRGTSTGSYALTPIATGLTQSQYSDTNVSNNTTYYYVVSAVDDDGYQGANSAEASVEYVINDNPPQVDAGVNQSVAMSGEAAWTPALISPTGWYDASDTGSILVSGNAVTQWTDKSGNDLNLSQDTAGAQPSSGTTTINGLNAIDFDGSDDVSAATDPFEGTVSDGFIIMVHRVDSTSNGTIFSLTGSGSGGNRWQAHAPYSGQAYFDVGGTGGDNRVNTNYGVSAGDVVLVSFYGSTTDSVQEVYKNGTYLVGDATGHSVATVNNIHLGGDGTGSYQDTSLGEVIIINGTVSQEDRWKLEGYLAHKWGLADELPEGHLYKAAPPGGAGATADLDGSAFDADGNPMTYTWSKISGSGVVSFSDGSALDPTAYFSEADTYVLQLEADDGVFQTTDTVTITVTDGADTDGDGMDDAWEITNFGDLTRDGTGDFDSDGSTDLDEFNNSTDPTVDDIAPVAPTGLGAAVGDGQISLDWDSNGESDLNSYTVYRSITSGSGYSVLQAAVGSSDFVDTSAVNGTTYYYVVTAVDNNSNESDDSSEVTGTPVGGLLVSGDPRDGGLTYETYANEGQLNSVHTVPDYSRAGYGGGGVEIPFVPAEVTLSPSGGDDTTAIQNAIDTVSALPLVNGFRGAVLLTAGDYTVSDVLLSGNGGALTIAASGVVIRGEGQQETGGTTITYTATTQSDLFHFHGSGGPSLTGSSTAVTDSYVPTGSKTINVGDASTYAPGDLIRITYLHNQQWVDDINMGPSGNLIGDVDDPYWDPAWFQVRHYRYVESVNGNEITLDAPLVETIDTQYGGAEVQECTYTDAIENVGIENIRLESTYTAEDDEDHGWEAIEMRNVVNGWARQVTARYFGMGLILVDNQSKFVTVEDCAMLDPKSITTGGRKYSFNVDDSGYNLVQRTFSRGARHDYATGSVTPGPNVFADSHAVQSNADSGPHFRWATGELYDNIKTDTEINVQNRGNAGTSHGWSGAQIMFWNVDADSIICDAPTGSMNWSIGAVGTKAESPSYMSPEEPFGIWQSHNQHVAPRSLYFAQLEERLGTDAVRDVTVPEQEAGNIWSELQTWEGDGLLFDGVICWVDPDATLEVDTAINLTSRIRDLNVQENLQSTTWSKASGPGNVVFGSASSLDTTAEFDQQGTYVLNMTADDGSDQVVGSITLEITDPNYVAPPLAPTGLVATANDGSVDLDWNDNAEANVTYTVMRSTTSGSGYSAVQSGLATSAYTDNSVSNGTTYFYVVTASFTGSDPSENSNQQSATPNAAPAFDSGTIIETGATEGQAYSSDLADNASDDDGDDLTFTKVSGPDWLIVAQSGALSGTPLGSNAGPNEWTIEVTDGNGGSDQATLQITVADVAPGKPSGLQAVAGNGTVNLDWADSTEDDIASYSVYRSTTEGSGYVLIAEDLVTSDYADTSAENDTTYYYVIKAVDDGGNESVVSDEVAATPEAPTTVNVLATDNAFIRASEGTTVQTVTQTLQAHRGNFIYGAREGYIRFPLSGDDEIGGVNVDDVGAVTLQLYSTVASSHTVYVFALLDGAQAEASDLTETTWTGGTAGTEATGGNLTPNNRPLGFVEAPANNSIHLPVSGLSTGLLASEQNVSSPGLFELTITGAALDEFKQLIRDDTNGEITILLNSNGSDNANLYASVFNTGGNPVPTLQVEQADPPAAPSGLVATPGDNSVALNWNDNGEPDLDYYIVYRSTTEGSGYTELANPVADSQYTDSTAENGTTYYYVVSAVNTNAEESAQSGEASATPVAPAPNAPTGLSATGGNASVALSWTDNSDDETGFIVQRSASSGGSFSTVTTTDADATSYTDSGLAADTTYYYQIIATNANGNSDPTDEASATTFTKSEAWRDDYFGQTTNDGNAADTMDYDGDGLTNLLERAFGTNPTASGNGMPGGEMTDDGGTDYLSITYRRLTGGTGTTGVDYTVDGMTYTVEYDTDLVGPWSSGSVVQVGDPIDNGDGTETVTVRLPGAVNSQGKQFIRLKVESAP